MLLFLPLLLIAVYLSNYAGINHSYLVIPLKENPTLIICHALHVPNAKDISVIEDVHTGGMDLMEVLGQRLKELGLQKGKIGIVGPLPFWWSHTIPVEHDNYLKQILPQASVQVVTQQIWLTKNSSWQHDRGANIQNCEESLRGSPVDSAESIHSLT